MAGAAGAAGPAVWPGCTEWGRSATAAAGQSLKVVASCRACWQVLCDQCREAGILTGDCKHNQRGEWLVDVGKIKAQLARSNLDRTTVSINCRTWPTSWAVDVGKLGTVRGSVGLGSECLADQPVSAPQGGEIAEGDDCTGRGAASAPQCAGLPSCGMWRRPSPPHHRLAASRRRMRLS